MPGRVGLDNNKSYINGIMEIAEKEIIIHKKSFFRGKDRGTKHIRYDKITSIDFDEGKFLSSPSIQLYLSSITNTHLESRNKGDFKSFYLAIKRKNGCPGNRN